MIETLSSDPKHGSIIETIASLKFGDSGAPLKIPFKTADGQSACLEFITDSILQDEAGIALMAKWRDGAANWFPARFKVTLAGTKVWAQKALLDVKDRVLFWVLDAAGARVGHVGLFRLSPDSSHFEIDNILRGEAPANQRIIFSAIQEMLLWQRNVLGVPESYLRVFADNQPALKLYHDLGYAEIQRVPLKKVVTAERTDWIEIKDEPYVRAERYLTTMYQQFR